ncbi:MAG: HRDC domain-containing protein [Actinomycetota bacterium]|nr:HRDC domain-containing protein [Actinomycetota bacterium]
MTRSAGSARLGAPGPGPGTGRGPSARVDELLPALSGVVFVLGGHRHRVLGSDDRGARAAVGDGPATTTVAYGTTVTVDGRPAVLAHPAAPAAWEQLRAWRAQRAAALGRPAFTVFDDKTLRVLAALLPTTEPALLRISGIGPVKLQAYGDDLIALAEEMRRRHGAEPSDRSP